MSKIIRDKYDSIIEADRLRKVENASETFILLREKIDEELKELSDTAFNDIYEYADVIEVLYAMADFQGISKDEIEIARLKKLDDKGGFKKHLVLKN